MTGLGTVNMRSKEDGWHKGELRTSRFSGAQNYVDGSPARTLRRETGSQPEVRMTKSLLRILGASLLIGIGVGLIWGSLLGLSFGLSLAVIGTTAVVLRRNQQDLRELEGGQILDADERASGDQDAR